MHLLLSEPSHNYKCTVRGVTYKILEPDDDINRARKWESEINTGKRHKTEDSKWKYE
jgi:hypothetical protein